MLGEQTEDLEGPARLAGLGTHVACGLPALARGLVRLAARRYDRPPLLSSGPPCWERVGADGLRAGLLILTVALPFAGPLAAPTGGTALEVRAVGTLAPVGRSPMAQAAGTAVHGVPGKLPLVLVLLHLEAVIWHGIKRRVDVLGRMIPPGRA